MRPTQLRSLNRTVVTAKLSKALRQNDRSPIVVNELVLTAPSNMRSMLQEQFLAAVSCYMERDYRQATTILQSICDSIGSSRNLTIYTASAYNWLASAIRNEWLQTPRTNPNTAFRLERQWKKAISNAVKTASVFEDELPHAHREHAWYSAFQCAHSANAILRDLRYSIIVAQRLGMSHEEMLTLQDWYHLSSEMELSVPPMEPPELARWKELCSSTVTCNHCLHPVGCDCVLESDIELEVEKLRQSVCQAYATKPLSSNSEVLNEEIASIVVSNT